MTKDISIKKPTLGRKKKEQILFYISFAAIPILQFIIYYVVVNFRTVLFAFQSYDIYTGKYSFNNFQNFSELFQQLSAGGVILNSAKNSLILYGFTFLFGTTIALVFSYYVYKKFLGSTVFRIILYLPHIISSVSIVSIYKYFVDTAFPYIWERFTGETITGLLANLDTQFYTIMFASIYLSFGNNVLIYTSSMSGISESVVESAELDGVSRLQEFWHITMPMIFPTFTNFIIAGLANLFVNQMLLYDFYAETAEKKLYTLGYYMYREVQQGGPEIYPHLSSIGFLLTVLMTTITLIVRRVMIKFGPSVD